MLVRPHSRPLVAALLLAATASAGCAARQKQEDVVWPIAPEKPRIKYVRTLTDSSDVASGARRFWERLAGKRPLAVFNPTYLALDPDGRLYVACTPVSQVLVFDFAAGTVGRAAAVEGFRPDSPYGLAVDGDGNLYVGDQKQNLVWVYGRDGRYLRQIGKGMFERPTGVAFDRQRGLLYVVDGSNGSSRRHRVEVFDRDGRHLRTIGTRGEGPGQFNFPSFIAVAPDGDIYVADTGNFRIQVFDPEGQLVKMYGSSGDQPGQFGRVKGMAFDSFGNLYVVDGQTAIVQMFSPTLRPLMAFGGPAARKEFMAVPNGIAIDANNNIYVSDYGFNHVNQYVLFNTTKSDSADPSDAAKSPPAPAPTALPAR